MRNPIVLTIKDRSKVPRELYDYTAPETQIYSKAHSIGLLIHKVREGYVANQLPIPENLARVVEQDWCDRNPHHCEDPDDLQRAIIEDKKESTDMFTRIVAAAAIPAADALAVVSKALGIDCATCQRRHKIIKEMRKLGFVETLRRIKDTLHA